MINPQYHRCRFLLSAASLRDAPPDLGAEVAFAGRSNAGKSSAINTITRQKALARTSKTPGRTQLINFFTVDDERRLVDLPGYGYAKVSATRRSAWHRTVEDYLVNRRSLRGIFLMMDIRHPLKDYDRQMLGYAVQRGLPAHALLTKADKLGRGQQAQALQAVKKELFSSFGDTVGVQTFSAESKQGVEEARAVVAGWLGL